MGIYQNNKLIKDTICARGSFTEGEVFSNPLRIPQLDNQKVGLDYISKPSGGSEVRIKRFQDLVPRISRRELATPNQILNHLERMISQLQETVDAKDMKLDLTAKYNLYSYQTGKKLLEQYIVQN